MPLPEPASYLLLFYALAVGLIVGSFLNVVIHRLPQMLERGWQAQCAELRGENPAPGPVYNLVVPRSACPACGAPVQRIVYADNETNYCARCQTGGRLLADRALSRLLKASWPRHIDDIEERIDQIRQMGDKATARRLAKEEGLLVGIGSGHISSREVFYTLHPEHRPKETGITVQSIMESAEKMRS